MGLRRMAWHGMVNELVYSPENDRVRATKFSSR